MTRDEHKQQVEKTRRKSQSESSFKSVPDNLWRARILQTNDFEYCSPLDDMPIERGDFVVISSRFGRDMARILGPVSDRSKLSADQVRTINRLATAKDYERRKILEDQEKTAFDICRKRIENFGLPMKLVKAHYLLDDPKLMFFFTAENRIDFRELVKELVTQFKTRIELRQVGVRDESRMVGGIAVCGRQFCCHRITDQLSPVSIKMAKEQNLTLNSQKISGPCGRLLCCLDFEYENYKIERGKLPKEGNSVICKDGQFQVTDVDVLSGSIHVRSSDGRYKKIQASHLTNVDESVWTHKPDNTESHNSELNL